MSRLEKIDGRLASIQCSRFRRRAVAECRTGSELFRVGHRRRTPRAHCSGRRSIKMPLLELQNISKHFGAIQALNDVSLSLEPGQVVGLMGDNGAGKSTLVKIIAGNFRPTHGTMRMDGQGTVAAPAGRGPPAWHRDRLSGSRAVRQSDRRRQCVSRPRDRAKASARSRFSTTRRCTGAPARSSQN